MQNTGSFRLIVRRGPQPNQVYELAKDSISLGRDITNDIVINDPEVSRHHGRITRTVNGYTLEDLGSTNGTFINGQRLTGSRALLGGEMIGLGETVTLSYDVSAAVPAQPSYAPQSYTPVPQSQAPVAPVPSPDAQSVPPPLQQPAQPSPSYSPYAPPVQGNVPGNVPPVGAPQGSAYPAATPVPSFAQQAPPYAPMTPPVTTAPPLNPPGQVNTFNGPPAYAPYGSPAVGPVTNSGTGSPSYAANSAYPVNTPPVADPYPPLSDAPRANNSLRWILLGCGILILLCIVFSVAGLFYIDANNLYCKLPIVRQIVGLVSSQCVVQ